MYNDAFNPRRFTKDSELQDILMDTYRSTKVYCEVFHPDIFNQPFGRLHDDIFELIDDPIAKKKVIAAPRGIGKTSVARAIGSKRMLFRDIHFLPYISKSEGHAMLQTENMKREMLSNDMIRKVFGSIKISDSPRDIPEEFSKKSWVALGSTIVVPRGSGQQVRGLNWIKYRPDYMIIDDLEDDDTIDNERIRQDRRIWYFGSVEKAVPQYPGVHWEILYIDTIKHEDALIVELLEDDDYESLTLSVCDDDYKTNDPVFAPQIRLDKEINRHREQGTLDLFARERMSVPVSKEDAAFKPDMFQYYDETDEKFIERLPYIRNIVIVDPAKTAKMHSKESGIFVWGIDVETNALYQREARGEKHHPDTLITDAFGTALRYKAHIIAVEQTGLNEYITFPFENEAHRRGHNFQFIWLNAKAGKGEFSGIGGGKKGRVAGLIPFYRQGLVFHNRANCGRYEQQLLYYPKSKLWDIMDAGAYVVVILDEYHMFFMPVTQITEGEGLESEYKQLESEDLEEIIYDDTDDVNRVFGGNNIY